jgi:hypothetical protein
VVDSDPGVDEPEIVLPIAWHASTQQHPVAYSSSRNTSRQEDLEIPAYSPGFDNTVQKEWLKKSSTSIKGLGTKNHERSQPVSLLIFRNYNSS